MEDVRRASTALAAHLASQPWVALVLDTRPDDGRVLADQVSDIVTDGRPAGTAPEADGSSGLQPTTSDAARRLLHVVSSKDLAYRMQRPGYDADQLDAAFVDLVRALGDSACWWSNHNDPEAIERGGYAFTPLLWTTFDAAIVARGAGAVVVIAIGDED